MTTSDVAGYLGVPSHGHGGSDAGGSERQRRATEYFDAEEERDAEEAGQEEATEAEREWAGYREELLEIFRTIDDDDDGAVDFGELLDLGRGESEAFSAEKCAALLGRMDDDHNGSVTRAEFVEFFGKMMEPHTRASNEKGMVHIRSATLSPLSRSMPTANAEDPCPSEATERRVPPRPF